MSLLRYKLSRYIAEIPSIVDLILVLKLVHCTGTYASTYVYFYEN